jgi:hypothetical protein
MQRLDAHAFSPEQGAPSGPAPRAPGWQHGTITSEVPTFSQRSSAAQSSFVKQSVAPSSPHEFAPSKAGGSPAGHASPPPLPVGLPSIVLPPALDTLGPLPPWPPPDEVEAAPSSPQPTRLAKRSGRARAIGEAA